jgi:sigma-B regulation protein RsbU (phosphoserine phosphatase)
MDRLLIEYHCRAELEAAGQLRKIFSQVLSSTVHEKNLHNKILLCLSEAVTNIARHGQPKASEISIRFQQTDQTWALKVADNGGPYDPNQDNHQNLSQIQQEAESGRGISLMHASCNHIDYVKGNKNEDNLTIFSWPVNQQTDRARILLVEDEASVRRLYQNYLQDSYEVLVAQNGQEAMDILTSFTVDLVLSDINMPTMDGLTLRSEITRKPECELTPFVFITAREEDEIKARATSLGIDDYILKPVNKENLISHIERVLQRNHQIINKVATRINRKISQSFALSIPKHLPHWKIAASRRDTGAGGGDLLLSHSNLESSLFTLIDTMGHDETAKFFSYAYGGFISGLMRAASSSEIKCHELLQHISETVYDDELLSKVTLTGIVFKLDPEGVLTIACAAHPQPLLITSQSIETIPVEGILPGLLPGIDYSPVQITVKQGERIAIYTDGLVESAPDNQSRESLENQMLTIIKDTINLPIDRASRLIMQKFDEIAGTPPRDDTTFILLEPDFSPIENSHA